MIVSVVVMNLFCIYVPLMRGKKRSFPGALDILFSPAVFRLSVSNAIREHLPR